MDIWIIRNGEKVGPIHDYELRHKIEAREVDRNTPAWHEGLDAWRPLCEIALFKDDFNWVYLDSTESGPIPPEEEPARLGTSRPPSPPSPPSKPVFGRRFWARWLDIHVYLALWWLCMWGTGRDIEAVLNNIWIIVAQLVPWFVVEAILIHRYGTTPGKWLLGLRVTNTDGSPLSLTAATLRAFRILVGGIGFGWSLLALFCQIFSLITARRLGNPLWDHAGGHRVHAEPLIAWRVITVVALFFLAIQLQMAVVAPAILKSEGLQKIMESIPGLKQELQKNPPWHLSE